LDNPQIGMMISQKKSGRPTNGQPGTYHSYSCRFD